MHIRHLRKVASKILGLQHETTYSQNYFIRKIQNLCKSVFSDCCIELEVTADNVERAASSTNHAQYLIQSIENHCPALPQDIETKYQEVCSVFEKSTIKTFLIIVPYLIQNIKDIFAGERISEVPQNGLRGLPKETLDHFVSSVRNATGNNGFFELLCDACNLLEKLCLENYDKEPNTEIEKWGESMAMLSLLNYLQPFFQHCCKDIRLYKRLDLFVRYLRKTIADRDYIDELFVYDLSNVLMSLIHFAKIDPSKVVRFELNSSTDLPFSCPRETVRYDRLEKTYSQVFRIKRETEDELQLHATARVYIDGGICEKGTFQSTMMLTPSSEKALNGYVSRFHDVTVTKLEDEDLGNLRVFFSATRKEKLLELLDVLRKELRENVVDVSRPEVTRCPLSMRSLVTLKADTVLNLRLVYKWGSEAVVLDSKDFVAYTRPSQCVGEFEVFVVFLMNSSLFVEVFGPSTQRASAHVFTRSAFRLLFTAVKLVGVLSTDMSKAFDSLCSPLLIAKLKAYGFSDEALGLMRSYFCERKCRVRIDPETTSGWYETTRCCPQGSSFGPLLWNVFQNDLHYIVKNCTLFMYADDHQLSHAAESIKEVEQVLNEERNKVSQWYHKNLLKGNFSEYQTISFGSKQKNKELQVKMASTVVVQKPELKLLGVTLDEQL